MQIKGLLIFGLCFILAFGAFGFERARILDVSSTGRSIILDRGALDGLKEGMLGRFLVQEGHMDGPKLGNVAIGEAVKVYQDKSFWYLYAVYDRRPILKEAHLLFAVAKELTRGRKEFKIMRKNVVKVEKSSKNPVSKSKIEERHSVENKFIPEHDLYESKLPLDNDVEVEEFTDWEEKGSQQYIESLGKEFNSVSLKDIESKIESDQVAHQEKERVATGMVQDLIVKINDTRGHLKRLYRDQERDPDNRELHKYATIRPLYFELQEKASAEEIIHPDIIERTKLGGRFWSGDMSDEQLRRFFIESGLMNEVERRKLALENRVSHEFLLRFNYGLNSMSSSTDPNYQAPSSSVLLGYEWHLMRTSPKLKRWSVELAYEYGTSRYDLDTFNVSGKEASFHGNLNYYFFNLPSSVQSYTYFLGTGLAFGGAEMKSVNLSKKYTYNKATLPQAHIGMKYRMRSGDENDDFYSVGFGFHILGSYHLHRLSTNDELEDNISSSKSFSELKFSLGISLFL